MKTSICVRWDFEGFHCYAQAPEEVAFLKHIHRHIFKCSAKIEVFHDNRELEFFIVQRQLKTLFNSTTCSSMSCEMIAEQIVSYLISVYPNRDLVVEVSEDGENSAIVEYTK